MLNLKPLVHQILEDYSLPWHGTHGVGHWARVLENGLRLRQDHRRRDGRFVGSGAITMQNDPLFELIAATFAELGAGDTPIIRTVLLKDRYFVGHCFR